ncbi:MAG: hypothetical protein IKJ87_04505 [Ruminococcus sp.]|nr:hypothetical protein [Ruminococcus sp.]
MKKVSYRVALGGIVSALCLLCMFLAGIMPLFYLILPMAAGMLLMIIAEEVSVGWAWLTYLAVDILSLLITADKESALVFIMLFGHYPMVRLMIEKLKFKPLKYILKGLIFNVCAVSFFLVTVFIFGIDQMMTDMEELGQFGGAVFLILGNIVFWLYDFNLGAIYVLYLKQLLPKFRN